MVCIAEANYLYLVQCCYGSLHPLLSLGDRRPPANDDHGERRPPETTSVNVQSGEEVAIKLNRTRDC
ncbi:hypothetical protein Dimus_002847 [Dionaea muscipula]